MCAVLTMFNFAVLTTSNDNLCLRIYHILSFKRCLFRAENSIIRKYLFSLNKVSFQSMDELYQVLFLRYLLRMSYLEQITTVSLKVWLSFIFIYLCRAYS
jgi:hypothetical protein